MSDIDKLFSFFVFNPDVTNTTSAPNTTSTTSISNTTNMPSTTSMTSATSMPKKYKKKSIPKNIKLNIWNTYIGEDIMKHKCFCCKKITIKIVDFEAGHVLSEFNGGSNEINNFRPICRNCNLSMGTMHMEDYIKKYGLYI